MGLPTQPVTLTTEQLGELNGKLSNMRHDINNNLSLIMAAVELIRHKPHLSERMLATLVEQPASFRDAMAGQSDKIRDLDERLRAARKHMMDAALAKDFDEKAVRQIALDAARLDAEMMVVRMKALAQVRPRLAPEQIEKIRSAPPPGAPEGAGERLSRR